MKTIETMAVVGDDRRLTLQLPPDVALGPHQIVIVVDGPPNDQPQAWTLDDWPVHDAALIDPNFTMRREEMYGDDGR
jgi:hypothetical protein